MRGGRALVTRLVSGAAVAVIVVTVVPPASALADSPCPARDGAGWTLSTNEFSNISTRHAYVGNGYLSQRVPGRRHGLPVDRREDGLAALHAPVRRRVRGRPVRCRPGHRERPDDRLRDPDLVDARADGGIRDVLADDARRRGLELQPDAVPGLRASADIADVDDGRRAADRTGLRRCRRLATLAAGDVDALRAATEDRLHQDRRLSRVPRPRATMEAALRAGAWGAWLSGSGPSVAAFADAANADAVATAMPTTGHAHVLAIDDEGARIS